MDFIEYCLASHRRTPAGVAPATHHRTFLTVLRPSPPSQDRVADAEGLPDDEPLARAGRSV